MGGEDSFPSRMAVCPRLSRWLRGVWSCHESMTGSALECVWPLCLSHWPGLLRPPSLCAMPGRVLPGPGLEPERPSQCSVKGSSCSHRHHFPPAGSCSHLLWPRVMLLFVSWWQPQSRVGGGWAAVPLIGSTFRWQNWCRAVMAVVAQVPSGSAFTCNWSGGTEGPPSRRAWAQCEF